MEWTNKPPKKPGWYFYQRTDGEYPIRIGYVVFLFYPTVKKELATLCGCHNEKEQELIADDTWSLAIKDLTTPHRWAGPIPEPEERENA